jgi:hypothetical protein
MTPTDKSALSLFSPRATSALIIGGGLGRRRSANRGGSPSTLAPRLIHTNEFLALFCPWPGAIKIPKPESVEIMFARPPGVAGSETGANKKGPAAALDSLVHEAAHAVQAWPS